MKKILTITVPCYNSEAYMKKCIDSLLVGGEEVEIIIVDDGSTDRTAEIADEYAANHPTICKVIHQENGGHGEAVNTGIKNAAGYFFKVVDSDDRVNKDAYMRLLDIMKNTIAKEQPLDMLISNYVYDKVNVTRKKVMRYANVLPVDKYFTWDDVGHFRQDQYITMHSIIYRTALLRESEFELPKHTFYVDSIFMFRPLPLVKVMYYADVNFYWYFIGREDQSVHENVMIKRIDQQLRVNKILVDCYEPEKVEHKKCRRYMRNYVEIITTISSIMCLLSKSEENMKKRRELWKYIRKEKPELYAKLRKRPMGFFVNANTKPGKQMAIGIYKICQKIFNFN